MALAFQPPTPPKPGERLRLALIALFFLAAPTAGDIGSCSKAEDDLDPEKFFNAKQSVDCDRCNRCGLTTQICQLSCGPDLLFSEFPEGCAPLAHDGDVCIAALLNASCNDYATFVADQGAVIPTECNFCPPDQKPQ